jgi:ribonuclease Z
MTTTVTLTGTGLPNVAPGRAGAGVFVKHNDVVVQFDAGRATCNRLIEAGLRLADLDAVFITHIHSDHVFGLAELVLSRIRQGGYSPSNFCAIRWSRTFCEENA